MSARRGHGFTRGKNPRSVDITLCNRISQRKDCLNIARPKIAHRGKTRVEGTLRENTRAQGDVSGVHEEFFRVARRWIKFTIQVHVHVHESRRHIRTAQIDDVVFLATDKTRLNIGDSPCLYNNRLVLEYLATRGIKKMARVNNCCGRNKVRRSKT